MSDGGLHGPVRGPREVDEVLGDHGLRRRAVGLIQQAFHGRQVLLELDPLLDNLLSPNTIQSKTLADALTILHMYK